MQEFDYIIQFSNRKTITIIINAAGVIVKAPHEYAMDKIEALLLQKRQWIEDKLLLMCKINIQFENVKNRKTILYRGKEYPLYLAQNKNKEEQQKFYFKNEKAIQKFFIQNTYVKLEKFLSSVAKKMQVEFYSLKLVNFKAKWGSCDSFKNIKLNWRIVMLPDQLIYYVVVHELAHLLEMSHSPKFWKIVEMYCKDYKNIRKQLKEYAFLADEYR